MFYLLQDWVGKSSTVTLLVAVLLSLYFLITFWIFIYRFIVLMRWQTIEKASMEAFLMGHTTISPFSALSGCAKEGMLLSKTRLEACIEAAKRETTIGLTWLSVIATTSPFVGLFGTVVGILQSFSGFKEGTTLSVIAPAISEALIATAIGILVAIPAYTFHLLLKRKAFEVVTYIGIQADLLASEDRT